METIWANADRVFFEHGVALRRVEASEWRCEAAVHYLSLPPTEFGRRYGLRPITAIMSMGAAPSYSLVFPARTGKALDVQLSELQQLTYAKKHSDYFRTTRSLIFLLYAVIYHTKRLAVHYADAIEHSIQFPHHTDADRVTTHSYEAFFEFDAMVTAAIRAIDSTRYALWQAYGEKCSVPSSLRRTIDNCRRLPDSVKDRVEDTWDSRLAYAKEYRDCIQHYVAVGSASWAMLTRIDNLFWTMLLRIPDNPEAKSAKLFTFDRNLDAMTYAWELVTDVFDLAALILQAAMVNDGNPEK